MSEPSTAAEPVRIQPRRSVSDIYFFGRGLYPASPLSWTASLWYYGCGVVAAGYLRSPEAAILPPLMGAVLVVPLLGSAWRGALAINERRLRIQSAPSSDLRHGPFTLPYALPSSAGEKLTSTLTRATSRWLRVRPLLGLPLLELGVSSAAAAIVAAALGASTMLVTLIGLIAAIVTAVASRSTADNELAAVSSPLLLCWLVALSLGGKFEALPIATGVCLALSAASMFFVERTGRGLVLQLIPQVVLILAVALTGATLACMAIGFVVFAQMLWAPALTMAPSRARYYQSLQAPWMAAMLVAALAVGLAP